MRRAIERSDFESLISFYAEDAELLTVNRNSTPSSPEVLGGKEAIAERLEDVCGRAMTHRIANEVRGKDRIAFNEACEYQDGGIRVLAATALDGQIVRQVNVEA
jgi:hypothetical protein